MFCWHVDMKPSFGPKNGPKIGPKTVPNRVQNGLRRVLDEDRISNIRNKQSEFTDSAGALAKMELLDPVWGGKQGGGHNCLHTPEDPQRGVGGFFI